MRGKEGEREKEKWWRIEGREDGQNRTRQEDGEKKIILHFVPPYCFLYCKRNWTDYSGCSWGFWRELSISSLTSSFSLVFTFSCACTSWSCVLCTARLMINIVFTHMRVRPTPVCRLADTFTKLWLDNRQDFGRKVQLAVFTCLLPLWRSSCRGRRCGPHCRRGPERTEWSCLCPCQTPAQRCLHTPWWYCDPVTAVTCVSRVTCDIWHVTIAMTLESLDPWPRNRRLASSIAQWLERLWT